MSDAAQLAEQFIRQAARRPEVEEGANNVFRVLHGFYGNLFMSKYSTGQTDAQGNDAGIVNTRRIWAHGLKKFSEDTVKSALADCLVKHPEFPPSLPQFVALCQAWMPRQAYRPAQPALGMSQGLRSKYAAQARAINAKYAERKRDMKTDYVELPVSLDGLKLAIADAVSCAGGDEGAELARLDRLFGRPA